MLPEKGFIKRIAFVHPVTNYKKKIDTRRKTYPMAKLPPFPTEQGEAFRAQDI
jgi:hypothetical protein